MGNNMYPNNKEVTTGAFLFWIIFAFIITSCALISILILIGATGNIL